MKAVAYDSFGGVIDVRSVPDPVAHPDGVVVEVRATGLCRSDWHGWKGHDPDIQRFPHVPGHELAGIVVECGAGVEEWRRGDRVTVPFVAGCGSCEQCAAGHPQVCDHQFQPGFTGWGSLAQFVALRYADANLVRVPPDVDFVTAAALGCRFGTAFRAVADQAGAKPGQWVAVHGCGGVGLSVVMIAAALGAQVIAVDTQAEALRLAQTFGATATVDATAGDPVAAVVERTGGGAHVSVDALGSLETCTHSIQGLRKRGRHVQIGLMTGDDAVAPVLWSRVVAHELELVGSHGIQASRYPGIFEMIAAGRLDPGAMVHRRIHLDDAPASLMAMDEFATPGVTVVDTF